MTPDEGLMDIPTECIVKKVKWKESLKKKNNKKKNNHTHTYR